MTKPFDSSYMKPASLYLFMTRIEKILIQDEELLRLLTYKPMGFDEKAQTAIPDPLSSDLPNLVDVNSSEYWTLVKDRIRKGDKRTNINDDSKCVIYLQEGRERSIWGNAFQVNQEVILSILVHEDYEDDFRMSRIRDRVYELLIHKKGMAGFGKFESIGGDPRDTVKGFRRIDFRMTFANNKAPNMKP
jgi:hypothetical protein